MKNLIISSKTRKRFTKFFYNTDTLLLLLLCSIMFVSHALYVFYTYQYPKWDEHVFMPEAIQTFDLFRNPSQNFLQKLLSIYIARPPVYGLSISMPLLIFGLSQAYKLSLLMNGFYYIGSIIGVYLLGKLFLSKGSSFLAAFTFSCFGFPLFYLHFVYSETAATMFVIYALLFLAKSNYFMHRKESIYFAIIFFLCVMTRWTTPIFIAGAFIPLILSIVFSKSTRKKLRLKQISINIIFVFLIALLLPFFIYYIPNKDAFTSYLSTSAKLSATWVSELAYLSPDLTNTLSVRSVMFYFNILSQQTIYFFFLFGLGFLFCLRYIKKYSFLLFTFLFAYSFLTLVFVLKDDRYIVPIYPIMAIISAIVYDKIKYQILRIILITLTLILGSLNFLGASWGIGPLGHQGLKDIVLPSFIHHPRRMYLTTMIWPPRPNEIYAQEMIDAIQMDATKNNITKPTVLNTYTVNPMELDNALNSIQLYSHRNEYTFLNLRMIKKNDYADLFNRLKTANYLIITNHPVSPEKYSTEEGDQMIPVVNAALWGIHDSLPILFAQIATMPYPLEKITVSVYRVDSETFKKNISLFISSLTKADPKHEKEIIKQSHLLFD